MSRIAGSYLGLIIALVTCLGIAWILKDMIWAHVHANEARHEVFRVFESLPDGASREQVEDLLRAGGYRHLQLVKMKQNEWLIETPLLFGAKNWLLWIQFSEGRIESLRIRTQDSMNDHPKNAPPDREISGWVEVSSKERLKLTAGRGLRAERSAAA